MFNKLELAKFIPEYQITKKKYQVWTEAVREVGSGVMVSILVSIIIDATFIYLDVFQGLILAIFLWYISSQLVERS